VEAEAGEWKRAPVARENRKFLAVLSTRFQQIFDTVASLEPGTSRGEMYPSDHGLTLVQLKERRREMVVALQNRSRLIGDDDKISAIQQTVSAIEDVMEDIDCELRQPNCTASDKWVHSFPPFGRRPNSLGLSRH
jgi:hypothetical protein